MRLQVQTGRSHGLPAARMADLAAAQAQLEAALAGGQPLTASLLRACLGAAAVTGGQTGVAGAWPTVVHLVGCASPHIRVSGCRSPATRARRATMHIPSVLVRCQAGLGAVAARSLQAEFDDAVAALQLATDALEASRQQLAAVAAAAAASEGSAEEALAAVRQALGGVTSGSASGSSSSGGTVDELLPALRARLAEWQQRVVSHQDPSRLLRWASGSQAGGSSMGGTHAGGGIASGGSAEGGTEG